MGNQAGIIIRNVKNELFHSAKRLILNEVKGIECLLILLAFIYIVYEYKRAYREHDDYEDEWIKVFHMIYNLYLLH